MRFIFIPLCAILGACAQTIIHEDGTKTIVGFVNMTIHPEGSDTFAGEVTDVEQLGLHIFKTPVQTGVSVGYSRLTHGHLKDNVLVLGDPKDIKRKDPQ